MAPVNLVGNGGPLASIKLEDDCESYIDWSLTGRRFHHFPYAQPLHRLPRPVASRGNQRDARVVHLLIETKPQGYDDGSRSELRGRRL